VKDGILETVEGIEEEEVKRVEVVVKEKFRKDGKLEVKTRI